MAYLCIVATRTNEITNPKMNQTTPKTTNPYQRSVRAAACLFFLTEGVEAHVGLEGERADFGILHLGDIVSGDAEKDRLEDAEEEPVTDGEDGERTRVGQGVHLEEKLAGSQGDVPDGLRRGVEGMADLDVGTARVDAKVALAQEGFLLKGTRVGLGDDTGRVEGSLQVAADDAVEMLMAQLVAQEFGLPDALGGQMTGHLSLQYASDVLFCLPVAGYCQVYHCFVFPVLSYDNKTKVQNYRELNLDLSENLPIFVNDKP